MSVEHFIKLCSVCGTVISQCRCTDPNKAKIYEVCDDCKKSKVEEADITINGHILTFAQSMAVRVAVASMLMDLAEPEHMKALGRIGPLYQARLLEVQSFITSS